MVNAGSDELGITRDRNGQVSATHRSTSTGAFRQSLGNYDGLC
jgi:hypothetical protein